MRQSTFSETQIVNMLKEADAGRPVNEIWRSYGISSATYYKWKAKYGGLEASDMKRLKEFEHERPPQTDACGPLVGQCGAEGCPRKKALRAAERREVVAHMVTEGGLPVQRACHVVGMGRATYYRPLVDWARRDMPVIAALTTLVAAKNRWGFWKCCVRLRLDGQWWNHKRVWQVYCQLRLNLLRRTKKRLPLRLRQPLMVVPQPNAVWAVDFMSDTLYGGRRFRTVNVLDEGVREGLAIEIDTSLPAERVILVL
jgi:putative transposase